MTGRENPRSVVTKVRRWTAPSNRPVPEGALDKLVAPLEQPSTVEPNGKSQTSGHDASPSPDGEAKPSNALPAPPTPAGDITTSATQLVGSADASDGPAAPLVEQPSTVEPHGEIQTPNGEILPSGPDASPSPDGEAEPSNAAAALPVPAGDVATGVTEPVNDAKVVGFNYAALDPALAT